MTMTTTTGLTVDFSQITEAVIVAAEIQVLVRKYGKEQVQLALNYIADYPTFNPNKYKFVDNSGMDWYLSPSEFKRVRDAHGYVAPFRKIEAIKMFREITSCGLKEAKDCIENFDWTRV